MCYVRDVSLEIQVRIQLAELCEVVVSGRLQVLLSAESAYPGLIAMYWLLILYLMLVCMVEMIYQSMYCEIFCDWMMSSGPL